MNDAFRKLIVRALQGGSGSGDWGHLGGLGPGPGGRTPPAGGGGGGGMSKADKWQSGDGGGGGGQGKPQNQPTAPTRPAGLYMAGSYGLSKDGDPKLAYTGKAEHLAYYVGGGGGGTGKVTGEKSDSDGHTLNVKWEGKNLTATIAMGVRDARDQADRDAAVKAVKDRITTGKMDSKYDWDVKEINRGVEVGTFYVAKLYGPYRQNITIVMNEVLP